MFKVIITFILFFTIFIEPAIADSCFFASEKPFSDAQTIRKMAERINWKVGKISSITAATFIKTKALIYPQDNIEVCLKELSNTQLRVKIQSLAIDANEAKWRSMPAKKSICNG